MPTLDEAFAYMAMGFSIFPIKPRSKEPHRELLPRLDGRPSWKPFQTERATPDELRHWFLIEPGCNLGMATGALSGVFVVDADTEDACWWAAETFPVGPVAQGSTTWKQHYYFKMPPFRIANSAKRIHPGADVRGEGGLIILPPSIHPTGAVYKWLRHPDRYDFPDCPAEILEQLRAPEIVKFEVPILDPQRREDARLNAWARSVFSGEIRELEQAPEGGKHGVLVKVAARLGEVCAHGLLDEGACKTAMMNALAGRVRSVSKTVATMNEMFARGFKEPARLP